jgi:hypothetical protein
MRRFDLSYACVHSGEGLGMKGMGIREPIKTYLKFDRSGLGFQNDGDEGLAWWDRVYADALRQLKVEKEKKRVKLISKFVIDEQLAKKINFKSSRGVAIGRQHREGNLVVKSSDSDPIGVIPNTDQPCTGLSDKEPGKTHRNSTGHRITTQTGAKPKRLRKQEKKFLKDKIIDVGKNPRTEFKSTLSAMITN